MNFKIPKYGKSFFENLKLLYQKNPQLNEVLSSLNNNKISYGLFAGTQVWLFTSNRKSTDLDFLVADGEADKLKVLFLDSIYETKTYGQFIYLKNTDIEFSFNLTPVGGGNVYSFRLTETAMKERVHVEHRGRELYLMNPADTVLLKAMLQRGIEEGKHDLEDIKALTEVYEIDKKYLSDRFSECQGDERVMGCLKKFGLI